MNRVTYHDEYLTVTDVLADGQLVARRILLRSEFGGVEKESTARRIRMSSRAHTIILHSPTVPRP